MTKFEAPRAEAAVPSLRSRRPAEAAAETATGTAKQTEAEEVKKEAKEKDKEEKEALRLLRWDELPDWRRDNAFIRGGYRATSDSYRRSLASAGRLHNESVNIWSHLLGAAAFAIAGAAGLLFAAGFFSSSSFSDPATSVVVMATTMMTAIATKGTATATVTTEIPTTTTISPVPPATPMAVPRYFGPGSSGPDALVFSCFFAGALLCLGMSATFHALCNHSSAVAAWANKLDYSGIVFLIVGSYVPALYYGFFCLPTLMTVYLYLIFLLGFGCLAVSWFDHFRTPDWRPYRALMFVALGLSSVVPVIHGTFIYGLRQLDERMGLRWVVLQGGLYIFGAFLYAIRWPERRLPGKFDIWGSSHQIFHVCVLLAAASHLYGMGKAFDYHHATAGAC